jgi:hypothetical protein
VVITTVLGAPFDAVTVAVTTTGVLTVELSGISVTELDEPPLLKPVDCADDCPDEDEGEERLGFWELLEDGCDCAEDELNDVTPDDAAIDEVSLVDNTPEIVEFRETVSVDKVDTVVTGDVLLESETIVGLADAGA